MKREGRTDTRLVSQEKGKEQKKLPTNFKSTRVMGGGGEGTPREKGPKTEWARRGRGGGRRQSIYTDRLKCGAKKSPRRLPKRTCQLALQWREREVKIKVFAAKREAREKRKREIGKRLNGREKPRARSKGGDALLGTSPPSSEARM